MVDEPLLKLKMLILYRGSFRDWYREVWKKEAHSVMCCNGYMCGCQASTYADMWEHHWKHRKASQ